MMNSRFVLKILKLVFLLSTAGFFVAQFHIFNDYYHHRAENSENDHNSRLLAANASFVKDSSFGVGKEVQDPGSSLEEKITGVYFGDRKWWAPSADDVRRSIEDNNLNAPILNEDQYGPIENVHSILVVQVHDRAYYFSKLIESLSKVPRIGREALMIVSYDYYSKQMYDMVKNITAFRVMQIFYPYSMQLYSNRFPGTDSRDCNSDMTKQQAEKAKCLNWKTPDKYGHYRRAELSQIKHHWWWKINYVFDGIERLRNFDGWIIFLEEDHYVSPDILHTFDYIVTNKERLCSECSVITLGSYFQPKKADYDKVSAQVWFSSQHNMGMAINRTTWNEVKKFAKNFCSYDDYNWDWSLLHVSTKLLKNPLRCLVVLGPRVFHIGDCGTHHKHCTADTSVRRVVSQLNDVRQQLFPQKIVLSSRAGLRRSPKPPKENGGWGDVRDHKLCMNHVINVNSL
ncbi:unnamed protein product [Soboliphyme baturini]|uniref:Alpha-1,6-mannosyl-glycoprotein 2-beta-N-acetylglucosaminyltransferase n=1 Tax=Soboliphyme baturini TaxID=241478 RepID=A0A183IB46_9BILA|nr:unnamed protein product [Soboliphyme baturini]